MNKTTKNIVNSSLNTLKKVKNRVEKMVGSSSEVKLKSNLDSDTLSKEPALSPKIDAAKKIEKLFSDVENKNVVIRVIEAINDIILGG